MSAKRALILGCEKLATKFRSLKDTVQLPVIVTQDKSILICLPEDVQDPTFCQKLIAKYKELFNNYTIQFCATSAQAHLIKSSCSCLFYSQSSLTITKKLDETIKQVIRGDNYQIAIDLNQNFSLTAALICKSSKANTRITFAKPNANIFFNILVAFELMKSDMELRLAVMRDYLQAILLVKQGAS